MAISDIAELVRLHLPIAHSMGFRLDELEEGHAIGRLPFVPSMIRPGGTVAGPALMALADFTMYAVVLSLLGPVALAVTTSFNMNFLRKPGQEDVLAVGSCLKLGSRLAVLETSLRSVSSEELVAHATGTYSIPPRG